MTFDYYASLGKIWQIPEEETLSSELVDICSTLYFKGKKEDARDHYIIQTLKNNIEAQKNNERALKTICETTEEFKFSPSLSIMPDSAWIGFEVEFILKTPWYSKNDRIFHVLENSLRKDRVFGIPYQSASSWKGLLRWACRMESGLFEHLEKNGMKFEGWKDDEWILYLFGNEKNNTDELYQGVMCFYPTFFDRIGFEVINPHNRKTRAGTQPIYYEVVPPETKAKLQLVYAPHAGCENHTYSNYLENINKLLNATEKLLTIYGFSAKHTSGWGNAEISKWRAFKAGMIVEESSLEKFKEALKIQLKL